jgi:microsomal dipeptidase-like Zn-dependent dipeptidase
MQGVEPYEILARRSVAGCARIDSWEHVAIGTDFDGFTDPPDDCSNAGKLPVIQEMLEAKGVPANDADAVLGGNARRVLGHGWR